MTQAVWMDTDGRGRRRCSRRVQIAVTTVMLASSRSTRRWSCWRLTVTEVTPTCVVPGEPSICPHWRRRRRWRWTVDGGDSARLGPATAARTRWSRGRSWDIGDGLYGIEPSVIRILLTHTTVVNMISRTGRRAPVAGRIARSITVPIAVAVGRSLRSGM